MLYSFRFEWSCYQLDDPPSPCFPSINGSNPTESTSPSLVFHTSTLLLNESTAFVFVLQVSKEGYQPVQISQVLYVRYDNPIRWVAKSCKINFQIYWWRLNSHHIFKPVDSDAVLTASFFCFLWVWQKRNTLDWKYLYSMLS